MDAVKWSDVVVLTAGIDNGVEHEGIDRKDTLLPAPQVCICDILMTILCVCIEICLPMHLHTHTHTHARSPKYRPAT